MILLRNWVFQEGSDRGLHRAADRSIALAADEARHKRRVARHAGLLLPAVLRFLRYSDVAVGLGLKFRLQLPQNLNSYKALDPSDFWRR